VKKIVIALAAALLAASAPDLMAGKHEAPPVTHTATGVIKKVEPGTARVTLRHDPIAVLGWPSMTMPFVVKDRKILAAVKPEQRVEFDFVQAPGGAPIITAIR
jgi:Cu(I)/Ag(I) efflux system protein CusF